MVVLFVLCLGVYFFCAVGALCMFSFFVLLAPYVCFHIFN